MWTKIQTQAVKIPAIKYLGFFFGAFMRGKLIVMEGVDGTGKRTQSAALVAYLEEQGYKTSHYSYPDYKSPNGMRIYAYLHGRLEMSIDRLFNEYLEDMLKDKAKIEEDLEGGKIVVVDRYFMSTIAYQSAQGFGYERAKRMEDEAMLPRPDMIIYFEMPLYVSVARKEKQRAEEMSGKDRFEGDEKIQRGAGFYYNKMMEEGYPTKNWIPIQSEGDAKEVHKKVAAAVEKMLKKRESKMIA
jgi:dTMP kinase